MLELSARVLELSARVLEIGAEGFGVELASRPGASASVEEWQEKAAAKAALDLRAAISPEPSTRETATSSASACAGGGGTAAGGASSLCRSTSGSATSVGSAGPASPSFRRGGGFSAALLRTRRVRPGKICTLQIPAWFQLSGHLRRAGGRNAPRERRIGSVGGGRWVDGGWWAVVRGMVRGVVRGAWRVARGEGFQRRGHPWMPQTCSTSPSSYCVTGANLTRLVTPVCPSAARLVLRLTNAVCPLAAPWPPIGRLAGLFDMGGQSEANRSSSSAGSDLMTTPVLVALPSAARGDRISSILKDGCREARARVLTGDEV